MGTQGKVTLARGITAAGDVAVIPVSNGGGIAFSGVGKAFGEVGALDDVTFDVERHSRIGIVGPSGGGKSTLLQLTAGLLEPDRGTVNVEGATIAADRLSRCALMPQRDLLLPWRTALDNAVIALENHGVPRTEAREKTRPFFERFGLASFEDVRPSQLSGGMRQRVSFLRTLMAEKDVLLLDEPFGALDSITRAQMQEWLLGALGDVPRTVLLVTHDVEEALVLSRTVVVMSARPGRVVRIIDVGIETEGHTRREIVTSPEFVELKETALEAIE
jgi:ABC-type nitrate/sulfonate/bicarbonate transport system ATPase subunit